MSYVYIQIFYTVADLLAHNQIGEKFPGLRNAPVQVTSICRYTDTEILRCRFAYLLIDTRVDLKIQRRKYPQMLVHVYMYRLSVSACEFVCSCLHSYVRVRVCLCWLACVCVCVYVCSQLFLICTGSPRIYD